MLYDIDGNEIVLGGGTGSNILVAAILDAGSDAERFSAMKEILDIGKKKMNDPNATISASEFTHATKGAVCLLPTGSPAMYQRYDFDMLYTKNADVQACPASVTKTMSLITGLDYLPTIEDVVTLNQSDMLGGSGAYFSAGDTMTIKEVMLSMMLPSSNTGAQVFARVCGAKMLEAEGTTTYTDAECRTKFVEKMNKKAAYIGMSNSVFVNASGASSDNLTTAADLIRMIVEACSYPEILKVWNKKSYTISIGGTNPRTQELTTSVANQTLENSYYIFGGKTGALTSPKAEALVMVAMPKA